MDAGGDLDDPLSVQCSFDALRELHFKSVSSETTVVFSLFFPDDERSIWENRGEPPKAGIAPSEECGAVRALQTAA